MVTKDPIPADQEELAEQAIAECPRAAPDPQRTRGIHKLTARRV